MASIESKNFKHPELVALVNKYCSIYERLRFNPHTTITDIVENTRDDKNLFTTYCSLISCHPSNKAVEMMLKDPSIIDPYHLTLNMNRCIFPLLEMMTHRFEKKHWDTMAKSHNPVVLGFLLEHPDKINWNILCANESDYAIKIMQNNYSVQIMHNRINFDILSGNPNPKAFDLIENNVNSNPYFNIYMLARNPHENAVRIIRDAYEYGNTMATETLENFSLNPGAIDTLMQYPELIKFNFILQNPGAIDYLETHMTNAGNINYENIIYLIRNPNGLHLVKRIIDEGLITLDTNMMINIACILCRYNKSVFEY
jgi:hypothetical protein